MTDPVDPEGHETRALHELVDFDCRDILEIGCGDGRMTWRYADTAATILDLDPVETDIRLAEASNPALLRSRVSFQVADAVSAEPGEAALDVVVLGRSE